MTVSTEVKMIYILVLIVGAHSGETKSVCQFYGAYYGHDIDSSGNIEDLEQCKEKCTEHHHCSYWTFDTITGDCNLKHGMDGEPLLRPWLDMISGPRYC